ncbi:hypothetical protein [Microcoleus sp. herbarium12]
MSGEATEASPTSKIAPNRSGCQTKICIDLSDRFGILPTLAGWMPLPKA